jgi:hypothetical protein
MYLPLISTDNTDQKPRAYACIDRQIDLSLSVSAVFISGKNCFFGQSQFDGTRRDYFLLCIFGYSAGFYEVMEFGVGKSAKPGSTGVLHPDGRQESYWIINTSAIGKLRASRLAPAI